MTQSLFRALCASLATAAVFSVATPASAATITFTDNNCSGFSVPGSAPNFTLVCQALACTLGASPSAPTPGGTSTMTASCSGGVGTISYSNWTSVSGGSCPLPVGSGQSVSVTSATAVGPCTYRVTGTDTSAMTGTATTSVTWSSTGPVAPTGCTLTASPSSLAVAGSVTLTASCSGGGTPTGYTWSGPGVVTPTSANSQVVSVAATTTFSVIPSNSGVNGNTASATATAGGGGGRR